MFLWEFHYIYHYWLILFPIDGFVWGIPHYSPPNFLTRNAASTEAYVVSGGSRVLGSASDIYLKAGKLGGPEKWSTRAPKIAKVDSLQ